MAADRILLCSAPRRLVPGDSEWPSEVSRLKQPPLWLRVAGTLPDPARAIAVVGTRHADEEALAFAHALGAALARAGCAVVSGGAYGIDAAAHRGALEGGGRTLAVLATGLIRAYPPRHGALFTQIAEQGALVTEAEDDGAPHPGLFLQRNRLIAALARAVVVVRAPLRSGALSTAAWAKQLEKPLLVVPAAPWDPRGEGCLRLLSEGATICTGVRDVLSVAAVANSASDAVEVASRHKNGNDLPDLDEDERAALEALRARPAHPDEVARRTGLPAGRVQRALLSLTLHGIVDLGSGGRYGRIIT